MKTLQTIIISFLFFAVSAFGSVGSIVAVNGDVSVQRGSDTLKAITGMKVEEKDTLHSKGPSKAQVLFNDKTVITIGKDATFKIAEYLFEADQEPKATFDFAKGAFRTITGQIGKAAPERFTLKSKTATIGIRGTQILGDAGQQPGDTLKVAFTEGKGFVQTPQGSVEITAGQITRVDPGKPPTPPRAYKPAEINQMGKASGGGGEKMEADDVIDVQDDAEAGTDEEVATEETAEGEAIDEEAPEAEVETDVETEVDTVVEEVGVPTVDTEILSELVETVVEVVEDESTKKEEEEVVEDVEQVVDEVIDEPTDPADLELTPYVPGADDHQDDVVIAFDEDDPYVSWGVWVSSDTDTANLLPTDILDGWVAGDISPESKVAEYILNEKTASYSGGVNGIVNEAGTTSFMSNGSVNLNIDFGAAANPVTGNIQFDANSEHWNLAVGDSGIQQSGFTLDSFRRGANSDVAIGSGSGVGNFYGPDLDSVGGKFSAGTGATVDGSDKAAYGIFTGSR